MRGLRLQFITHCNERFSYIDSARLALEGGCRWIQLRVKDIPDGDFCELAVRVREMCNAAGAIMIIDDRVHLLEQTGADGVHLGRSDMPVAKAREAIGSSYIIGGTANTLDDVAGLSRSGADYVGCGPFRFTTTKKNLAPQIGLEGYKAITEGMKVMGIAIPVVAIGGITYDDIAPLAAAGIDGIALSGSVLNAPDPASEMKRITEKCESVWTN